MAEYSTEESVNWVIFLDTQFDLYRSIFTKGEDRPFENTRCRQWLYRETLRLGRIPYLYGRDAQQKSNSFLKLYRARMKVWKELGKIIPHSTEKNQWILKGKIYVSG